jgi:hypothetical protein
MSANTHTRARARACAHYSIHMRTLVCVRTPHPHTDPGSALGAMMSAANLSNRCIGELGLGEAQNQSASLHSKGREGSCNGCAVPRTKHRRVIRIVPARNRRDQACYRGSCSHAAHISHVRGHGFAPRSCACARVPVQSAEHPRPVASIVPVECLVCFLVQLAHNPRRHSSCHPASTFWCEYSTGKYAPDYVARCG